MDVQVALFTGMTSISGRGANALTGSATSGLPLASAATFAPLAAAEKPEWITAPPTMRSSRPS